MPVRWRAVYRKTLFREIDADQLRQATCRRSCGRDRLAAALVCLLLASAEPDWLFAAEKVPLTPDAIFVEGGPTGRVPQDGKWRPDGRMYTYILRSDDGSQGDLWALDPATAQATILLPGSLLSKLNPSIDRVVKDERERERLTRYAVAGYFWSPDSTTLLFTSAGKLYLVDAATQRARSFLPELDNIKDPQFSPDGKWISFVRSSDLWISPLSGGAPVRLTHGGSRNVLNGDVDWVYQEELDVRSGYRWSDDSRRILFLQLDQTEVGETPIVDFLARPHAATEMQKYPKAGQKNPKAKLGVVTLDGKEQWLGVAAEYIPRFQWADDDTVAIQLLNRPQNELELLLWNLKSRTSKSVLKERDAHWINVTDDLRFLAQDRLLWTSERDGFRHLYLYRRNGELIRRLTQGEWEVGSVGGLDASGGWVYFTATEHSPIERHLYRVRLDGSGFQRMDRLEGTHSMSLSPTAEHLIDSRSTLRVAPEQYVVTTASMAAASFFKSRSLDGFDLVQPQHFLWTAPDGAPVRAMLLPPAVAEPGRKYPLLVYVYGGPHNPVISNAFLGERFLWHQWMAHRGYAVAYIDDRTSAIPGHKYETALYKRFGFVALQDHRVALQNLRALPFIDPDRVGIWGWSGGGYTTCFNLANAPDLFQVGIAVAPLTDFADYDTLWTERYMGLPQENSEAYRESSAPAHAHKIRGRLLLIHGTADDNVHLQNTVRMAQSLVDAGRMFDLFLYPGKTHGLAGVATHRHLYTKMQEYLDHYLKGEASR